MQNSDPIKIKNKFRKLRTITQNQFNFRSAKNYTFYHPNKNNKYNIAIYRGNDWCRC